MLQIIRGNNTLIIFNSTPRDSGTYICEADNGYSSGKFFDSCYNNMEYKKHIMRDLKEIHKKIYHLSDRDSIRIQVENVQISEQCEDNPHFANCKLIVRAQYCTNKYYAKFCCRSCTIAGQLRGGRGRG